VDGDLPVERVRAIAVAIWRQVARDLTSHSPEMRVTARDWLESEMAGVWARRFDPAIDDPDLVVQALLTSRHCRVQHTRHTAAARAGAPPGRVSAPHEAWEPRASPARR